MYRYGVHRANAPPRDVRKPGNKHYLIPMADRPFAQFEVLGTDAFSWSHFFFDEAELQTDIATITQAWGVIELEEEASKVIN